MKKMILAFMLLGGSLAQADTIYTMRVDGLACPYCAYGVEKKLKKITGVKKIDVDLDKGIVTAVTDDSVKFTDEQMTKLFKDSGFTFRSMKKAVK